jgi:hypothetical protein
MAEEISDGRVLQLIRDILRAGVCEGESWQPTLTGVPQGGVASPPTKLPTFFSGSLSPGYGSIRNTILTSFWATSTRLTSARMRSRLLAQSAASKPPWSWAAKASRRPRISCTAPGRAASSARAWLLQTGKTWAQVRHPGLTLGLINPTLGLTVDQPGDPLSHLTPVACHGRQRRAVGGRLRLQAVPLCLCQPLGGRQPGTAGRPPRQVPPRRPHRGMLPAPLPATAVRIRAQTAGRGLGPRRAVAGPRAAAFPVAGRATGRAWEPALPQIPGAPVRWWPGRALVLLPLLRPGRQPCGRHARGDRERAPGLRGDSPDGDGPARLHGPGALGPPPGAPRLQAGLAPRRASWRRWRLQDPPTPRRSHTVVPVRGTSPAWGSRRQTAPRELRLG